MLRFPLSLAFMLSIACPAFTQSADSLLVSGRRMLHAGENQGSLDAMYASRATFERALADTSLAAWAHYYIALADFRIVNLLLGAGEKNKGCSRVFTQPSCRGCEVVFFRYQFQKASHRFDCTWTRKLRICWPPSRVQRIPLRLSRWPTRVLAAASTGPLERIKPEA